jgi:hypothetical protein
MRSLVLTFGFLLAFLLAYLGSNLRHAAEPIEPEPKPEPNPIAGVAKSSVEQIV